MHEEVIDICTGLSILYLFISYIVVTVVGMVHTIWNGKSGKYPSAKDVGKPITQAPAYKATEPFHPIYNLVVFPIAGYIELHYVTSDHLAWAWKTALLWTVISIIVDWLGWVVSPHPFRVTYKEFYVDYQPWITIIYAVIFISPFLALVLRHALA